MHAFMRTVQASVIIGVWLTSAACTSTEPPVGKMTDSLYNRLGGKPAIVKVIDEFVGNVSKDNRINGRFATTNIPRLKGHLVDQVCAATDGPCTYSGRDMITTHKGMGITNAEFSALVSDLVAALNTLNVPKAEQAELLSLLGPMKSDIVEIP
ncbi:group 1 truncated hemoglobin [Candidatus Nitronereus thalassa]|uniref:Group 1 truncated hemoglobin n=1 Tax=Candidatus Nitronereus thalassa TaxID=3020898 RepID=A0ABU3KB16_9BACT|nr:group 1 truncated hemoglobin [Candidatus Nitronereus thalassa]MDT7043605.1 group 1 truncated hemoglobin [Candidatus Nitronereus thalassa]